MSLPTPITAHARPLRREPSTRWTVSARGRRTITESADAARGRPPLLHVNVALRICPYRLAVCLNADTAQLPGGADPVLAVIFIGGVIRADDPYIAIGADADIPGTADKLVPLAAIVSEDIVVRVDHPWHALGVDIYTDRATGYFFPLFAGLFLDAIIAIRLLGVERPNLALWPDTDIGHFAGQLLSPACLKALGLRIGANHTRQAFSPGVDTRSFLLQPNPLAKGKTLCFTGVADRPNIADGAGTDVLRVA